MNVSRLNLVAGIISSVLILQCWFAGQAIGAASPVPKAPEPNAAAQQTPAQPAAVSAEPNGPSPKLIFEVNTHDFGAVAPSSESHFKFKFANKGAGALKINEVTKTCGCTVFSLTKKEYAPGEDGVIEVGYNADRGPGARTRHLYVLSNDKDNPRIELTIQANISPKITFEPEKLDFAVRGEKAGVLSLTVRSVDDQNFAITSFNATGDAVTAEFDPNKKDTSFVLKAKIDVKKTAANSSGTIEIATTHPQCATVTVPFSVIPRFKVDPPSINLLNAEEGKAIEREVWLLNNYDEDFDIASATSKEGIIKVKTQEKVGNRFKFVLDIVPPANPTTPSRMFTDIFTITTKDGEKIDVLCRGFYQRK